ncbi:MAG TPA: 3-deoxy-D-manno-octulosonic acid transferase [Pyrinomonadaceae bacterium]|nr:3-deoxy-D-manno-octulosonic acid transferase [Pyrinomonadaceae bacterium]
MYFLYSLLLALGFALLLPRFLLDLARHGKYAAGFRERTGSLPPLDAPKGKKIIWLHCVSVGETQAARPLARAILEAFPAHALVVSTTTETGQRVAREAFAGVAARVFYFPFDWAWSVRRALRAVNPSAVLVIETELWPRFFRECRARGVPVALVNGRISQTSFRRYRRIRFFIRRVVSDLSLAAMQSEQDAARIRALGLDDARVKVSGNVKFDSEVDAGAQRLTDELRGRFHFGNGRPLVAAASTHAPEERVVLDAFKEVVGSEPANARPRLLIAPRHPERFAEVAALVEASGLTWSRRAAPPNDADASSDVVLLDTVGELRAVYPLTDVVFVGGSVAPKGGHNILEPAAAARCVVTGAHTFNFNAITKAFLERDALVQLPEVDAALAAPVLAGVLRELLNDRERRARLGENARRALDENRGATARTVELLAPVLSR